MAKVIATSAAADPDLQYPSVGTPTVAGDLHDLEPRGELLNRALYVRFGLGCGVTPVVKISFGNI